MVANNMKRFVVACILVAGVAGGIVTAAPLLDQESPAAGASFNVSTSDLSWQQEVTVGVTGMLSRIELYASNAGTTPVYVNAGSPWQSDASEFSTVFTAAGSGWTAVDTSSANLFFNAGDRFVIGVGGADSGLWLGGSYHSPGGSYTAGTLMLKIVGSSPSPHSDWDLGFRTYVEPAAVPAPAALFLGALGTGLVGWFRTRRAL